MKKAVIYARYSSHNQREESIEGQLRKCHEYADKNGFVIIEEYIDRALSGKTDNRADFQRMIKDSEKGHFEAIILYTLDRFARNRYDSAMYKAKLRKNGVKLYYTEQSISDEPEGIILESVLEGMAEYYSQNLSRGVKRGLRENALKAKVTGGHTPLGYRKAPDLSYELCPITAPIVEEVYDLYANKGMSQRQIVDYLNEKGYRTAKGKPFRISSLERVLTNRKYTGVYIFGDIEIKGGIPQIVSEEMFNKVQEMLKRNRRTSGRMKAPAPYLLTGKLFCGNCGEAMTGESGTSHTGTIYNYYKCFGRRKKQCDKQNEKKEFIEKLVVEETVRQILQPDVIDAIAEKVSELAEREYKDNTRINSLNEELKTVQTSIKNLLKLVEAGVDTDDVSDRLLELNSQKADLNKLISKTENKKPLVTKDRVAFWLTKFITNGDIDDVEYQQRVIETLVNKVYVFDNPDGGKKIVITYNTSNNLKSTVSLSDIKGSDINGNTAPFPTNPNLFVMKNIFGLVIEIPSRV